MLPITHLRLKIVGSSLENFLSPANYLLERYIPNPHANVNLLKILQNCKETTGIIYSLIFDDNFDSDNWIDYGEGCETQDVGTWELTLLKAK
jgi:hypothetical protein